MRKLIIAVLPLAIASTAQAQQKSSGANVATSGITNMYNMGKGYLLATAQQIPAEKYSFKPAGVAPEVRNVGQILAHVADSNFAFCATAAGKPTPEGNSIEKSATTKEAIVAKLKESYVACDAAYNSTTDAGLTKMTTLFGQQVPISQVLVLNATHNFEHYGNLITYMRAMGMVPPSSQRGN